MTQEWSWPGVLGSCLLVVAVTLLLGASLPICLLVLGIVLCVLGFNE